MLYFLCGDMGVSKNRGGPPKSSILIGFSIINHPFWGTPMFGNIHILPFLIMEVENGGLEDDFSLLSGAIFHFHDYGRKGTFLRKDSTIWDFDYLRYQTATFFIFLMGGLGKSTFIDLFPCFHVFLLGDMTPQQAYSMFCRGVELGSAVSRVLGPQILTDF